MQTKIEKRVFENWIDFGLTKEQKKLKGDSRGIDMAPNFFYNYRKRSILPVAGIDERIGTYIYFLTQGQTRRQEEIDIPEQEIN